MIVVKVELHSAITGEVTELGKMIVANDGRLSRENPKRGDYNVYLARKGASIRETIQQPQKRSRVENFPRLSLSVWVLVARALKNLGIERFADFFEKETDKLLAEHGL